MYVIDQYGKNPIFHINNHIGFDKDTTNDDGSIIPGDGQGIDGILFSREFFETDALNPDSITIYINCMGGDVQQSIDIFTAIVRAKCRTKAIISGFAYSCAGWIPLAADIVEMTTDSRWMDHMPYDPNEPDESKRSVFLDSVADMIATKIADKSGRNGVSKKTKEEVLDQMKVKTYLTSSEMLKQGLIDKETTPSGKKVPSAVNEIEEIFFYKEHQKAINQQIKPIKVMAYPKVLNRLNLAENSGEDEILQKIAGFENKIKALNEEVVDAEKQKKLLNDSQSELQKKLKEKESEAENKKIEADNAMCSYNKLKADMENMEADNKIMKEKIAATNLEKTTAENTAKQLKAENLIKIYVDANKIAAANKEDLDKLTAKWKEKAVNDYEGTELMLGAIYTKVSLPRPAATGDNSASNQELTATQKYEKQRAKNQEEKRVLAAQKSAAMLK